MPSFCQLSTFFDRAAMLLYSVTQKIGACSASLFAADFGCSLFVFRLSFCVLRFSFLVTIVMAVGQGRQWIAGRA